MLFRKIITIILSLALITSMSSTLAKEKDKDKTDGLARVVQITAKDGQEAALEDAIAAYHHYVADKKGSWRYEWFSIETGRDTGSYIARSGNHNWADFDAEFDWEKEAGEKFASDVLPFIASAKVSITKTDPDLGIWPEMMKGYNYFLLTRWHIKSGMNEEFDDGLKKINSALKAGGWPSFYSVINTVSGGYGNTRLLVSPRKNFADMAPKKPSFMDVMKKAMGEDKAKAFLGAWGKTYKTGSYFMVRYMPKQSDYGK